MSKNRGVSMKLNHWYKIHIELRQIDGSYKVIHEVSLRGEEFNDNFRRFVDKQLEGLYGIDRMVIYYDTDKNVKEMDEIKEVEKDV